MKYKPLRLLCVILPLIHKLYGLVDKCLFHCFFSLFDRSVLSNRSFNTLATCLACVKSIITLSIRAGGCLGSSPYSIDMTTNPLLVTAKFIAEQNFGPNLSGVDIACAVVVWGVPVCFA